MTTITIHQPQYMPWPAYFDKILRSDIFVLLDDVQFNKNGLQNRNKIKTSQGESWLTLPVKHSFGQKINEVEIDNRFKEKHLRSIKMNYSKAQYFNETYSIVESVLNKNSNNLSQISTSIIKNILDYLEYDGEVVFSSSLFINSTGSDLVLDICKSLKADKYLSGLGALSYLEQRDFDRDNIEIEFQKFSLVEYSQCFSKIGFAPDLSIMDLLFNEGKNSIGIMQSGSCNFLTELEK